MRIKTEAEFSFRAGALLLAVLLPACGAESRDRPQVRQSRREELATAPTWPAELAGRKLQWVTDRYLLYANEERYATELGRWLDAQLRELASRPRLPPLPGLVLAIEPGEEPVAALEQWRKENVKRERHIWWRGTRRQLTEFRSEHGRPYCTWSVAPYFTESFAIPYTDALQIGVLSEHVPRPTWICMLTTDEHTSGRFDARRSEWREKAHGNLAEHAVFLLPLPGDLIMYLMTEALISSYRGIDLRLMRLQRREVLRESLIKAAELPEQVQADELARLQDQTDAVWRKEYMGRPVD